MEKHIYNNFIDVILYLAFLAQLVERLPCKQEVLGSIPKGGTI